MWINLFAGNNVQSDGKTARLPGWNPEVMRDQDKARDLAESIAGEKLSPAGMSAFFAGQAWLFVESFPRKAFGIFLKRIYMLLSGYEISEDISFYFGPKYSWLLSVLAWRNAVSFPMGILIPLFAAGVVLTSGNRRKHLLIYVLLLSTVIWPALFFVNIE